VDDVVEGVEIGVDHEVPIVTAERWKSRVASDAGIADHPVIRAMGLNIGFDRDSRCLAIGDVKKQAARLAPRRGDFGNQGLRSSALAAAMDNDRKAVTRQAQRNRPADAPGRTGDEDAATRHAADPGEAFSGLTGSGVS
jgi:hypothetical protein